MGISWGAVPVLAKIHTGPTRLNPLGVTAWVAVVTLLATACVSAVRGLRPKFTRSSLLSGLIAAVFAGVVPQVAPFWTSSRLPGIVISITLALEPLFGFLISAAIPIEKPSAVRLFGLMFGLIAVLRVMFGTNRAGELGASPWVLAVLVVIVSDAVESFLVASMPEDANTPSFEVLFFMVLGSASWAWGRPLQPALSCSCRRLTGRRSP